MTRQLITSTNKMPHPNRPALIAGSIPPTCTSPFGTHQRLPPANPQTKCGSFPPRALPRFVGTL